ncbi:S1 RNA-binding domain-containing protein [Calothrix sp. NIES-3974]|uniref:S1 RNA-binding domain-containing protein n=1 Tax=Calothrix sp. NIES-3974 TaxID=2005462 RepID=UPI000BBC3298|nr:S1 RNA-binding domain-containing protein [Calothrix sp. NIES-3974]
MNSNAKTPQSAPFTMDDFVKALDEHDYQFQRGQIVHGKVYQIDSDGAFVDIGGKSSAFVPRDEISLRSVNDIHEVISLNDELDFLIIRDQDSDGQVTLSRKQLLLRQVWGRLATMQENSESVDVRVVSVNKGGVTVNVEGLRGFVPRSHLLERENLEALVGQKLTVGFLEVDRVNKRIVLSQRLATRSASFSNLEIGQLVEGEITGIKPFGLFVDIDGVSALLHIKQVTQKFIDNLETVFQIGQKVKAIIIDLEEGRGRISLSTKVLENYPGEILENREEVMNSAAARAERIRKTVEN